MEKEYIVVVHKGVDLEEFDSQMSDSQGHGPIPSRSIDIANPRIGSNRMTHWMITDQEAAEIRNDPRVLSVEIPPDQRTDIKIGLRANQIGDFRKVSAVESSAVNWGLRRCIAETNIYGANTTTDNNFSYALDGSGVDVVIQDSGLEPAHPEWKDRHGRSRYRSIDWYQASGLSGTQNANHDRDFDGHGTHCAGVIAGRTYGWAKNALIYGQKLRGLEAPSDSGTGIPISDAFDCIRLWHRNKGNNRPTVVNMSWGYSSEITFDPTGGNYRGLPWNYPGNAFQAWELFGLVPYLGPRRVLPARVASVDAEIDDMVAEGIHVVIAAGNDYYKADVPGGVDYNNYATFSGTDFYYHRGSSPHSDDAYEVGSIDVDVRLDDTTNKDKIAGYSTRGPYTNIYAPGTNIVSSVSTTNIYDSIGYPENPTFQIASISGTSFAAPQVAGVLALHLQATPDISPLDLRQKVFADSKDVIFDTAQDNDYEQFEESLLGSPNRMLFSRYGKQPLNLQNIKNLPNSRTE